MKTFFLCISIGSACDGSQKRDSTRHIIYQDHTERNLGIA